YSLLSSHLPPSPRLTPFPYTTLFRSVRAEAVELDDFFHAALEPRRFEAVNPAVKLQVFFHRQIVVKAEILRHVADVLAHTFGVRSEEHTSELQSLRHLVCRLLLEKKK